MLNIADYYQAAMISQGQSLGEDCRVYSMDGHPDVRGGERDMVTHVGLRSLHCCDCFIFEKESISLIEFTNISETKNNIEKKVSYLSQEDKDHFSNTEIVKDNILKMYGSMVVLCWFARECKTMANNLKKKYKFWLVSPYSNKNTKGLDGIRSKLISDLGGAGSGSFVEVIVLSPENLKDKIKKNAVKPVSI